MLAQGFRHPAVLAKELATLDILSGGRLEVGIGAGWMRAEFEQAGIQFDKAPARIQRLEETVAILKGLFGDTPFSYCGRHFTVSALDGTPKPVQRPSPPIMIGGAGPQLLAAAARHADIIQVLPSTERGSQFVNPATITAQEYRKKIDRIREVAGARFQSIELCAALVDVTITSDPERAENEFVAACGTSVVEEAAHPTRKEILTSPVVAIGTLEQVCDKLLETRHRFGFSYFVAPIRASPESLAPVIHRLSGL
jgi:probable F420-dependent oxidoreductase